MSDAHDAANPHPSYVTVTLSFEDAQQLYVLMGLFPYVPGSWSKNLRDELSAVLAEAHRREYEVKS